MIYAGLINFNTSSVQEEQLIEVIASVIKSPPTVVRKKSLVVCYGKISAKQDMDSVWENESSILIGRAFDKEDTSALKLEKFRSLSHMAKEDVLKNIWGKYIYIAANNTDSLFNIVIDSMGTLPFFYYYFPNGNILFSSDIEIIFKVLRQKPALNWTYLSSYFVYGNSSSIQTPFEMIYELPPACSLEITRKDRRTEPFWDPLSSYKSPAYTKTDPVSVLQTSLTPWIEPYKNICVSLSGGLDSSALVYCLKDIVGKHQKLVALNYFHSQIKSSNELVHAKRVCEETGIELIEIDSIDCLPFDPWTKKSLLLPNKPFPGLVSLRLQEILSEHLPSNDSCLFLSGHGSDHIFMRPPSKNSISDYILENGFKGWTEPLKHMTHFYRETLFSLLKENSLKLASYFLSLRLDKRHPKNIQDDPPKWAKNELFNKISSEFVHPIYESLSKKVLPGKYNQIDAFYEALASIHMELDPVCPTHYPYLYQPVVEFALSFPTYDLFKKDYDRYPLRKAVSDRFNTQSVWRRDKSQTTGVFQMGIKKNIQFILDTCLNGHFVKKGLVDKEGLNKAVNLIASGDINHLWSFFHLVSAELFLKEWEARVIK